MCVDTSTGIKNTRVKGAVPLPVKSGGRWLGDKKGIQPVKPSPFIPDGLFLEQMVKEPNRKRSLTEIYPENGHGDGR